MNYLELNNSSDKNIFVLSGDDFIAKKTIKDFAEKNGISSINISKFNDENFNMLAIVNACNQFSFFNEKRIILIENLTDEIKTADKNLLLKYAEKPNYDCYLFIVDNAGIFTFLKNAESVDCTPNDKYVLNFVKAEFEKNGKLINDKLVLKLIEYCRANLTRLKIEIKKLCDNLGNNETEVTNELIEKLVSKDIELKVFELTNKLAQKDISGVHEILYNMLRAAEPPIKILGLISGFFRRAFYAKISKETDANLAKELGCKEFAIKKVREQVKNFTAKELKNIQNLILEVDYNIKSGQMTQENALYYLIMKIAIKY